MSWNLLKSERDYKRALERLDEVFHAPKGTPEGDEAGLLMLLIGHYEREHHAIPDADPIEVIRMQMQYKGLKQKDLVPMFGSKATASKILSYKRPLTLKHVWILSERLDLPVELLAKPYKLDKWAFMEKFRRKGAD